MEKKLQSVKHSGRMLNLSLQAIGITFAMSMSILIFGTSHAFAQDGGIQQWLKAYGGNASDNLADFIVEDDGGYLLAGYSDSDTSETKKAPRIGGFDYWIIRTDKDGNRLWDKTYGGTLKDELKAIVKTSDGGYLLIGNSNSPAGADKTAPFKSINPDDMDIWVVKIASNGEKLWDKSYGGSLNDVAASVAATQDGGFLLFGSSNSPIGIDKSEIVRPGFEKKMTPAGNILIPAHDYWLVKIDAEGTKQWDKTYGGVFGDSLESPGVETAREIAAVPEGGFILAGSSSSETGYERSSYNRGREDYWIIKIKDDGTKEWDKVYGGDDYDILTGGIEVLSDGYILGGTSSSPISGEKSDDNYRWSETDLWVIKISKTGEKVWDKIYNKNNQLDKLQSFHADERGIYILGTNFGEHDLLFESWDNFSFWAYNLFEFGPAYSSSLKLNRSNELLVALTSYGSDNAIVFIKFEPESYYKESEAFKVEFTLYSINAIRTQATPKDVVKVEFYLDSIKIGERTTLSSGIDWRTNIPKVHYVSVKVTTASGKVIKSPTLTYTVVYGNLYKRVNLNGPDVIKDGYPFFTGSANTPGFSYQAKAFANQSVQLIPNTDTLLTKVIRSSLYATKTSPAYFTFSDVPKGTYNVFLYVWEDNNPQIFTISLNGSVVQRNLNSGTKGSWAKVGPFRTFTDTGKLEIKVEGGDANISAIEVYKSPYFKVYQAVNLNGPATVIDNTPFESSTNAHNFTYQAKAFENQSVPLNPTTDAARAKMIRSSLYATKISPAIFTFKNLPQNTYYVYAYIWEDNYPQSFTFRVNYEWTTSVSSGNKGDWDYVKLGSPWGTTTSGDLRIDVRGGDANISGLELWQLNEDPIPASASAVLSSGRQSADAFPNPIQKELHVSLPTDYKGKATFTLYDMYGKTYLEKTKEIDGEKDAMLELPVNEMKAGIYFLKAEYDSSTKIIRLNKE